MEKKLPADGRGQVALNIALLIGGALFGWGVQEVFSDPTKIQWWVLISLSLLVCTVSFVSLSLVSGQRKDARRALEAQNILVEGAMKQLGEQVTSMATENRSMHKLIEDTVRKQATLIPRNVVYRDMAACIRNAQREVAVITYLMADWTTGRRTFMPGNTATPFRGEFYDALFGAIRDPKIEYLRIWQVPQEYRAKAHDMIMADELNAQEVKLIEEVSGENPHQARLRISGHLTTASFVLIDRCNLFFNIDFFDPQAEKWHSPYMLFIKDVTGESFGDLRGVIARLLDTA